jgi:hypothetical protein
MTTKAVTLTGYQRAVLALVPELRTKTIRGLRAAARVLQARVVEEISAVGAVNLGTLRDSVSVTNVDDGAIVTVDAPHAAPMEEGTRPFRPPLRPLMLWAQRKFSVDEGEAWRIARAVAAKIEKNGIEPRRYFATAIEESQAMMRSEIEHEIRQ